MTGVRTKRVRLDQLIVERGLAKSRSRAQALLIGGRVRVGAGDGARLDRKAGDLVDPATTVEVATPEPYVSRGGHKLAAALDAFGIDPSDRICLDVGASTGGFTDVLLQRGARRVYAVDVGRGQLAASLLSDPRVVSLERTNARTLRAGTLPEPVSLATVDVSFISLRLVLAPIASTFATDGGEMVVLVKPQFEAGRGETDGGVVKDPAIHARVLREVAEAAAASGLEPGDVIPSPLRGPEGNVEFLLRIGVPSSARAMKRIGFVYNPTSDAAVELRERAAGWAQVHGVDHWAAPAADRDALHRELPGSDVVVVLGGDGTFLRAARAVIEDDVPLLGINVGKVGFLSKVEASAIERVLAHLVEGRFTIEPRMALEGRILRGGSATSAETLKALNDVVIARGSLARVVRLDTSIDGSHLASFIADGLVVASPTGSTGYSFSAGGPILGPTARNLVVTPIAGYLATIRSVVVGPEAVVRCRVVDAHEALVSVDGREDIPLAVGDVVEVRAIDRPVRLVEPEGSLPFWDLVRQKVELLPS